MKYNCINFGGCYGYDLTVVFEEFLREKCIFSIEKSGYPSVDKLAYEYITFLQEHYDRSIEYIAKQNTSLVRKLIKIHNKLPNAKKILVEENTITNLYFR